MAVQLDLHIHTESMGRVCMDEKKLETALRVRGLDGIAVTNFANISHARWLQKKLGRHMILVGQEIWSSGGHIGAVGIHQRIPDFLSARETIGRIHDQEGVAIAVHPFLKMGLGPAAFDLSIDAVEVYNGVIGGAGIFNLVAEACARARRMSCVASSDTSSPDFLGHSRTEVRANSAAGVLSEIRAGRTKLRRRPLPVPLGFIIRNLLGARKVAPCALHAAACFECGHSLTIRLFRNRFVCRACGQEKVTRLVCSQGHFYCFPCVMSRISTQDEQIDIDRLEQYPAHVFGPEPGASTPEERRQHDGH